MGGCEEEADIPSTICRWGRSGIFLEYYQEIRKSNSTNNVRLYKVRIKDKVFGFRIELLIMIQDQYILTN